MGLIASLALITALGGSALPPDNPPFVSPAIYLAWDDCFNGGAGGARDKSFACNTNTGDSFRLIASVRPPAGLTQYVGHITVFDLQSATPQWPLWWTFSSGGCRVATSLTAAPQPGTTSCPDLESNPTFGGIDFAVANSGPNRARLRTAYAIDVTQAHPLDHTVEQTLLTITIDRRRTTGAGSCAGCTTPVCIIFTSVLLDQADPNLPRGFLTTPGDWFWATWQGGGSIPCPAATPIETRTWGQIKSLYR